MADPHDLEARRRAIRLPVRALAEDTELDEHTVGRALGRASRNRDVLSGTIRKVEQSIEQEERRLLAHLQSLHPDMEAAE